MNLRTPMRGASLLAAGALALAGLAAAPAAPAPAAPAAPAAPRSPVFFDPETYLDSTGDIFGIQDICTGTGTVASHPVVPVVENGAQASTTSSTTATYGNSDNPADTGTFDSHGSGTGRVTSARGNPDTLDFSAHGTAALINALGTSADCARGGYSAVNLNFTFTVTQTGILDLTYASAGAASFGEIYLERDLVGGDVPYVYINGNKMRFRGSTQVLLTPGTYDGTFGVQGYLATGTSTSGDWSATVHGDFDVAGSQTAAVAGKGKKYVTLGAARSCATHGLGANITRKKKRADQVKQVTFFVNDHKVRKVRTPDKGDSVTLAIADDVPADVVAEVKLFPKKKGRPGKVVEVSASYEACG